tara:strand:- start:418 stop:684 length:267 start_codon:yes stop_codon:yes gene_type:complete
MKKNLKIKDFREDIDIIDNNLIKLLEERFKISKKIGQLKIENDKLILDKDREAEIILRLVTKSESLSKGNIKKIFKPIFKISKNNQKE